MVGNVRDFFARNVYGELPPEPAGLDFALVENGAAFECQAERRQYTIKAYDVNGGWRFDVLVYLPVGVNGKVPVFVYPNFYGNHTLTTDSLVHDYTGPVLGGEHFGRGEKQDRVPVEKIISRGYGFVTYCYSALYPDYGGIDAAADSVWRIFAKESNCAGNEDKQRTYPYLKHPPTKLPAEKLAHPAWAWGAMRVRDLLVSLPEVDQAKVAIAGQSRMGKNACVVGVNDPRYSLVCANCGGTKWLRHLPNLKYPAWFSFKLREWVRNDKTGIPSSELETLSVVEKLPFEQDDYLAQIAPRALMISAAEDDCYAPAEESRAVYESVKAKIGPAGGRVAWHLKKGPHSITYEDWAAFLCYADELWKNR